MLTNIEVLAIFGAGTLAYWFAYAAYYVIDATLCALGHCGIYIKSMRWSIIKENPCASTVEIIRLLCHIIGVFVRRLGTRGEWKSTFEIKDTGEKWKWEPYFKYTRIDDDQKTR